jgi:hypothetical protein
VNSREFQQRIREIVQRQQRQAEEAAKKPPATETARPAVKRKGA